MGIELQRGQSISVTLYTGTNCIEAESLHEYLCARKAYNDPITLYNTEFKLKISEVILERNPKFDRVVYIITLKGELIWIQI